MNNIMIGKAASSQVAGSGVATGAKGQPLGNNHSRFGTARRAPETTCPLLSRITAPPQLESVPERAGCGAGFEAGFRRMSKTRLTVRQFRRRIPKGNQNGCDSTDVVGQYSIGRFIPDRKNSTTSYSKIQVQL